MWRQPRGLSRMCTPYDQGLEPSLIDCDGLCWPAHCVIIERRYVLWDVTVAIPGHLRDCSLCYLGTLSTTWCNRSIIEATVVLNELKCHFVIAKRQLSQFPYLTITLVYHIPWTHLCNARKFPARDVRLKYFLFLFIFYKFSTRDGGGLGQQRRMRRSKQQRGLRQTENNA